MKKVIVIIGIAFIIGACTSVKSIPQAETLDKKIVIETLDEGNKYVLLTFNQEFENWFNIHKSSAEKRDMDYYKRWNERYVNDWNIRSRSPSGSNFFTMLLDFHPWNYNDLALQRKLFFYFQYVENVLNLNILFGNSPSVVI